MKYRCLNHTNLTVSNILLGTDGFGSAVEQERAYALLNIYTEQGGNLLDTAECYSQWLPGGTHASENLLGRWMKEKKNRHKILISTKGGFYTYGSAPRLSQKEIFMDLEGSLRRLGTDYIDIYWLHRDAPQLPVAGIMDTLSLAVKQGKVRYIGVSNWTCERLEEANCYAGAMGYPSLIASQLQYSPARPNVEKNEPDLVLMNDSEYAYFTAHDLTVFAFAAQAKGFFSQYATGGEQALSAKAYSRYFNPETLQIYQRLNQLRKDHDCSIGAMGIAALWNNYDFDTLPIVGCKTIAQLLDTLSGADIVLAKEEMDFIFKQ